MRGRERWCAEWSGEEIMQAEKLLFRFACVVRACGTAKALSDGRRVHAAIIKYGCHCDTLLGNLLVQMYGKCGCLEDASAVFDKICRRNLFSWNILIWAYGQNGRVADARDLFNKMPRRNVICWSTMISVYAQNGRGKEAVELFVEMQLEGVKPDKITFVSVLDACANSGALAEGKKIHANIVKRGFKSNVVVGTALVNMYGKCGNVEDARSVFDRMPERNVVSWTAMITVYSQNGKGKEAIELYQQMWLHYVEPNKITFIAILDACASLAALALGKEIHGCTLDKNFELDAVVGTALVDMYGKCGNVDDAKSVFNKMPQWDVVSWTAMIAAYAQNGHGKEALKLFKQMQREGVKPDKATFISILSGCSHAGLLDDGWRYFLSMHRDYALPIIADHYVCMVDLLGRAGQLDEAEDLVHKIAFAPSAAAWVSLLGACRIHGDVQRGIRAAEHIFELDPTSAAPFVLLSNLYSASGMWDDASNVRKAMKSRNVQRKMGSSCIEVEKKVHEFTVRDLSHPQDKEIYAELQRLDKQLKEAGYVADTQAVLHNANEVNKEHILCYHSEKLAIAFGNISTPPGTPLLITKNLRVCSDCHAATKFISSIVKRKIIVRDANRFHHVEQGVCSCGDYW